MKAIFLRSFAKDLKKIRRKAPRADVQAVIEAIEQQPTLMEFPNLKRLTSDGPYYRVRIRDYRLGLIIESDTVTFVRFLHRRDIYRYFP